MTLPTPRPVVDATDGGLVRDVFLELSPQREAVALAYYTSWTQRQIAGRTGAPVDAVQTRLVAGMRRRRHEPDRPAGTGDVR